MNSTKQFYKNYIVRYKDGGRIKRFGEGGDDEVVEEDVQTSDEEYKPLISTGNDIADIALDFIPGVGLVNTGYEFYNNPTLGNAISLGGEALITALMFTPFGWGIKGARNAYKAGKGLKQIRQAYRAAQQTGKQNLVRTTQSMIKPTDGKVVQFAKNHPISTGYIAGIGFNAAGGFINGVQEAFSQDEQYNQPVDHSTALEEPEEEPEEELEEKYYWPANTAQQIRNKMNDGDTYTVQAYDTPIEIAKAAGLTLDQLEKYNKQYVSNGKWKTIHAGDVFNLKNPINPDDFKFSLDVNDVINNNLEQNKFKANSTSDYDI